MMATVRMDLPSGLGDILLALKIGFELSKDHHVLWPIYPQFWENGISRIKAPVEWCHLAEPVQPGEINPGIGPLAMIDRYKHLGIDNSDFASYIRWNRNKEIEQGLMLHLGLRPGEPFILVNTQYSFINQHQGPLLCLPKDYDGKIIQQQVLRGITLFEWSWIFENAEEIHTVDSAAMWMMETLDLRAKKMTLHPRWHNTDFMVPILAALKHPWEMITLPWDTFNELNQIGVLK